MSVTDTFTLPAGPANTGATITAQALVSGSWVDAPLSNVIEVSAGSGDFAGTITLPDNFNSFVRFFAGATYIDTVAVDLSGGSTPTPTPTPPPDLGSAIANNAAAPKTVTVDGTTATQQSMADQIAADKYLAAKKVRGTGIRFVQMRPPSNADTNSFDR